MPWRDGTTTARTGAELEQDIYDEAIAAMQPEVAAKQPLDSDLSAIAALTTTSFGRSLLTQVTAAAARSTLGAQSSIEAGTATGRPAAAAAGVNGFYAALDTGTLSRSDGSTWTVVASPPGTRELDRREYTAGRASSTAASTRPATGRRATRRARGWTSRGWSRRR